MRDAGYDDLLDAIEADEPYYLACPADHGSLPPRRVCPDCGATDLEERPLPEDGTVVTHTVVRVAAPAFEGDVPYVTAIADFGPVRLTGLLRDIRPEEAETGVAVAPDTGENAAGDRVLVLRA